MNEETRGDVGLLILRVTLGIVFVAHGFLKVFTFGLERAITVFEAHTVSLALLCYMPRISFSRLNGTSAGVGSSNSRANLWPE